MFVTWRIALKTSTEAVVEISDWEGGLAAGGQNLFLRKTAGDWYVVRRKTTWIS